MVHLQGGDVRGLWPGVLEEVGVHRRGYAGIPSAVQGEAVDGQGAALGQEGVIDEEDFDFEAVDFLCTYLRR